jgi:hypothetical protein
MVATGISENLNTMVQSILGNLSLDASEYEREYRTRVEKEAITLLIKQLKTKDLSEDLYSTLFDETKRTLTSLEPTEELPRIALSSLLTDWRRHREEALWQTLDQHLLGDGQSQLQLLSSYAYPSLMVGEMAQLRQKNAQLTQQVGILAGALAKKMSQKERDALQAELAAEARPASPRSARWSTMFGDKSAAPSAVYPPAGTSARGPSHL